jgi:ubiquinone/menaquinone biosynthesis C-methylase UbiE
VGQKEAVKKYFDDLSLDYQKAYERDKDDPVRTYIFNQRKNIVLDLIDRQSGRLLDIGCGPGIMTKELLKKNFLIYNTDVSPSMIERARGALRGHEHKDRVFFKVGDVESLDFDGSYFDVVLCIGVIEYLQDYHKAMRVISKVLKKGGTAIISLPNRLSAFNIIDDFLISVAFKVIPKMFNKTKNIRQHKMKTRKFIPGKFIREIQKYGLSKVSVKFHGYRSASLRNFFPKFWIYSSDIFKKVSPFLVAQFLANDCVIKFRKEKDV